MFYSQKWPNLSAWPFLLFSWLDLPLHWFCSFLFPPQGLKNSFFPSTDFFLLHELPLGRKGSRYEAFLSIAMRFPSSHPSFLVQAAIALRFLNALLCSASSSLTRFPPHGLNCRFLPPQGSNCRFPSRASVQKGNTTRASRTLPIIDIFWKKEELNSIFHWTSKSHISN